MSLWKRDRSGKFALAACASLPAGGRSPAGKLLAAGLAAIACLALPATATPHPARGYTARTIAVSDTGRLHLANPSSASSTLIEEGRATGTLPGNVRASLTIGTSTVRVAFTLYLHGGTITGHGTTSFNAGKGEYASFGGSIFVTHGGGHYAHATGTGRVYGTINRNTDDATVQVIGRLHV